MLHTIKLTLRRHEERARARRDYRCLLQQDDHVLRDIGMDRDEIRQLLANL